MRTNHVGGQLVSRLSAGYLVAAAVRTVLELRVPDLLAGGAKSVDSLAAEAGVAPEPLFRVMNALTGEGLFRKSAPRTFELTAASELLRDTPGSMRARALWITASIHLRLCDDLTETVRSGQPAMDRAAGVGLFDYLGSDPILGATYHEAATTLSDRAASAVLDAYDFGEFSLAVDVGGGYGQLMLRILAQYPMLRGVVFDRRDVAEGAVVAVEASGVSNRCQVQHGDFFEHVPGGGDVYLLKHILHDWDDPRASRILRNVRDAVGPGKGRVIMIETVLDDSVDLGLADLQLLLTLPGRERNLVDFERLLSGAGFDLTRVIETSSALSILEAQTART